MSAGNIESCGWLEKFTEVVQEIESCGWLEEFTEEDHVGKMAMLLGRRVVCIPLITKRFSSLVVHVLHACLVHACD